MVRILNWDTKITQICPIIIVKSSKNLYKQTFLQFYSLIKLFKSCLKTFKLPKKNVKNKWNHKKTIKISKILKKLKIFWIFFNKYAIKVEIDLFFY